MVLQEIPHDYIATIHERKPTRVGVYSKDKVTGASVPSFIVIPPLNANLDVSTLPRFDPKVHMAKVMAPGTVPIADKHKQSFNWLKDRRDNQSANVTKEVTKVGNQHACGCCWAFSSSDAVSDAFVINGKVKSNPRCSVTYALACYPNCKDFGNPQTCTGNATGAFPYSYQCNGGAIAPLLQWVQKNGLASLKCASFDWCTKNRGCTEGRQDTTALNYTIPACGCTDGQSTTADRYFISMPISKGLTSATPSESDIQDHIQTIKQWIYNYGTIVTGFFVYSNLMSGQFKDPKKNPDGIYLEDVNYHDMELFGNQTNAFEGGHAVCVIGWGMGPVANSLISDRRLRNPKGDMTMVPYWIVRNSWSEAWGERGLFKMAMYPFNKIAQFDKYVTINTPQGRGEAGGLILFTPERIVSPNPVLRSMLGLVSGGQGQGQGATSSSSSGDAGSTTNNHVVWMWTVLFVLLVSLVIIVLGLTRRPRRR